MARLTGPALIPAGRARPRNYVANTFPFRASSHFLYLVGEALEGAALWLDGDQSALVIEAPDAHAALWHGPQPGEQELSQRLGLSLVTYGQLARLRRAREIATVPAIDEGDAVLMARRLQRDATQLGRSPCDAQLVEALIELRLQHDPAALHELELAASVSVRAHLAGMRATAPGANERDVCAAMEHELTRAGCCPAYGSIVTVHGEVLHNHRHDNALAAGDLLLADVGAESPSGYASDITRTWPVAGRFSATQRELYDLVLAMQTRAIELVRPGVRYRDVHLAAARTLLDGLVQLKILNGAVDALLEDGAYALFFPHGIGHLLGLDVHDMEDLGDRAGYAPGRSRSSRFGLGYLRLDRDLLPGMLVTIEPGFYQVPSLLAAPGALGLSDRAVDRGRLAAFADVRGIRIEDDVLVTEGEPRVLTAALPKRADEIEACVGAR